MTIELPSVLSFERKLETSDALMFSGNWDDIDKPNTSQQPNPNDKSNMDKVTYWHPIEIIPRSNRSTQSAQGISDDKKSQPNPVASSNDDANLPLDNDTLKVAFSVRVVGNLGMPFACNSPDFENQIKAKVAEFKQTDMQDKLAKRYAVNIANGRFLWRNRVGAENITIKVGMPNSEPLTFNAYDYSLNSFDNTDDKINQLAQYIKQGLNGDGENFALLEVEAFVKLGAGQHVFPSQEMNMGEKRKVLFKIKNQAAIHNVKVGNALRTVDDWYNNAEFPIAAEPYGAVTQRGQAYRKSKNDLYTLMVEWVNDGAISQENQAYVVANLIRGGVFSKGGD